jgi:nucleotide-binding universal stress UspA family protein
MVSIRRIVCPVDFSDFSQHALTHAAALARWYDAPLTVLYVHRVGLPPAALAPGMGPVGTDVLLLSQAEKAQFIQDLQRFAAIAGTSGVTVDFKVLEGEIVGAIGEEAAGADLLVVGTHGRSGFERLVLGSVTEKLLRKAPCSVLTVPPASDAPEAPRLFARILMATDFSDESVRALQYACSLAQEANAALTVLHVIDVPVEVAHLSPQITDAARTSLAQAVPASVADWCTVTTRLETGRSYREIVRVATEEQTGLIVLGAHGRGAIDRAFFGSTAQHVVRQAHCPVLAVRR